MNGADRQNSRRCFGQTAGNNLLQTSINLVCHCNRVDALMRPRSMTSFADDLDGKAAWMAKSALAGDGNLSSLYIRPGMCCKDSIDGRIFQNLVLQNHLAAAPPPSSPG